MSSKLGMVSGQPEVAFRIRAAFPRSLAVQVNAMLQVIPATQLPPSEHNIGLVRLQGEDLQIPYRIYSPEPDLLQPDTLSEPQRVILACLYTRHHDGIVREKYLRQILPSGEVWVPPFVLQLVGEYVLEIILTVASRLECLRNDHYAQFVSDNPDFLKLIRCRIISYWNCYYRIQFPSFRNYPAFQVLDALGWWGHQDVRRLLSR